MVENIIERNDTSSISHIDLVLKSMENQVTKMEDELSQMEEQLGNYLSQDVHERYLREVWSVLDLFENSRTELYDYIRDLQNGLIMVSRSEKTPFTEKLREDLQRRSRNLYRLFFSLDSYDYLIEMRRLRAT